MNFVLVFIGGGIGSVMRYGLSDYIRLNYPTSFPLSTFTVNILSSLFLGFLTGWLATREQAALDLKLLLAAGFCGGFSTFSSFTFDLYYLIKNEMPGLAIINILASVIFCLAALYIGVTISKN